MAFQLKCLICGTHKDQNLVRIQEHVMLAHKRSQSDLQAQSKRELEDGSGYVYTFADGVDWLEATKTGNYIGGI